MYYNHRDVRCRAKAFTKQVGQQQMMKTFGNHNHIPGKPVKTLFRMNLKSGTK